VSYQIPSQIKGNVLLGETKVSLYNLKPSENLKFKNGVVTLYFKGLVGADFKMKINVYKDANGNSLMISSTEVNNQDITRAGDWYGEIRFDFQAAGNLLAIGIDHLIEFEILDGYVPDGTNFVAIVMETQQGLAYVGSDVQHLGDAAQLGARASFFLAGIAKQTDEKFMMVRLEGAKLMNGLVTRTTYADSTYGFLYLYETTIQTGLYLDPTDSDHFIIADSALEYSLSRVYTPLVATPPDSHAIRNKYYYNPLTGQIQFFSDLVISNTVGGAYAILKYWLFFTNFRGRYADPYMEDSGQVVYWEPRLLDGMNFDFSQQNNFSGILSISSSPILLKNQDRYLNTFFGPNDSFNNRQAKVWRCVGSTDYDDSTLEFVGTIRSASLDDDSCTFEIQDALATLDSTYEDERVTFFDELGYTAENILEADRRKIIPRIYGKRGPYELYYLDTAQDLGGGVTKKISALNGEKMVRAVNVSRQDTPSTSNNRTWSAGFGPAGVVDLTFDCTLHTHLVLSSFSASILTLDTTANGGLPVGNYFSPGDNFKNGAVYGIVYDTSDTEIYVWPYNAAYSAANDVVRKKIAAVVIKKSDELFYPLGGRDYSCSIGSGGDVRVVFVNNFEASHSGLGTLDPDAVEIYVKVYNDSTDGKLSAVLEEIVGYAGFLPGVPFAPAQQSAATGAYSGFSYPDPFVSFSLPFAGSEDLPTFRQVIEALLKTGMGFVYFDPTGSLRYKSFLDSTWENSLGEPISTYIDNQSGVDPDTEGLDETKSCEFGIQFDLYDLYSGVDFNFTHQPSLYEVTESSFGSYDVNLDVVARFYKTNRKYAVECLADIRASYFNNYIYKYVKLVCGRRASFSLRAFTTFGIYLGDDLLVSRARIVGSGDSSYMRVISLSKSVNDQKLELLDLKRFPGL
jgi:hypothetical protein